jgi:hypothetical protein
MPIGMVMAIAWLGVPVTTPRRTVALFNANAAADMMEKTTPSMTLL